jgi:hypothetical protein
MEKYTDLKGSMSIALLGYKIKPIPDYHVTGGFSLDEPRRIIFKDKFISHIIQVPRLLENQYNINNKLHRLLIFLDKDSPEELFKKVIEMDEVLKELYNILVYTLKDEKEMEIYERKLKAEME